MQDFLTSPEFFESFLPTTISLIITGLVSVAIGVFLERYRNKLTLIDYRIFLNSVAKATDNKYWGNIKVLYNNTEVKNLIFGTIEVRNNSGKDISNINVRVRSDLNTIIMAEEGYVYESNEALLLEDTYYNLFQNVLKENQEYDNQIENDEIQEKPKDHLNRLDYCLQNKVYFVPVFNRKTTLYFNFLVSSIGNKETHLEPIINKEGVKLVKRESIDKEKKKLLNRGTLVGGILYTLIVAILVYLYPDEIGIILLLYFLSLIYVFCGMGIYKMYEYLKNIFI